MDFKGYAGRIGGALALAGSLLAGCGGGDAVDPFVPARLVAFGDEMSVIEPGDTPSGGRKYAVNAFVDGPLQQPTDARALDCARHPLWIQIVARNYGMSFDDCRPDADTEAAAHTLAAVAATVADVAAQVDAFVGGGVAGRPPADDDLVLMMVGTHDVLELYAAPDLAEAERLAQARERGRLFALQVNRVALLGPAVIVSTMPDVGLTPYAREEGRDADLLSALSAAFNTGLRLAMLQDGKLIGLVFADALVHNSVKFPARFGYTGSGTLPPSVTTALCKAEQVLPGCDDVLDTSGSRTFEHFVASVPPTSYLWADALRPGPRFHDSLGVSALSRARNNPF